MAVGMRLVSNTEVGALKVAELGLDPSSYDLSSIEAISNTIRRTAGVLCPCSARTLIRAVSGPLEGLVPDIVVSRETIADVLEKLIIYGDLLEYREVTEDESEPKLLLYAAPPSFVRRGSGAVLILGIAPDHLSLLPDELAAKIEYAKYIRRLPSSDNST